MLFTSFWADLIVTLVGGTILTFIFFVLREKVFSYPEVNGRWYLEMKTVKTAYNPYKNMILKYMIIIWREGNLVKGTAEKVFESSENGEIKYVGKNRTRAYLEGYIEKNYFKKDMLYLHSTEKGQNRESTNFFNLIISSDNEMIGSFNSMIADQDGEVVCKREWS